MLVGKSQLFMNPELWRGHWPFFFLSLCEDSASGTSCVVEGHIASIPFVSGYQGAHFLSGRQIGIRLHPAKHTWPHIWSLSVWRFFEWIGAWHGVGRCLVAHCPDQSSWPPTNEAWPITPNFVVKKKIQLYIQMIEELFC